MASSQALTLAGPPVGQRLFCTFRLAGKRFGVDVLDVREVNAETAFTPIPHTPPEVLGYVNLRGRLHLALDLRPLLGMETLAAGPTSRLVIFKPEIGETFGVLVDAVDDLVAVADDALEPWHPSKEGLPIASAPGSGLIVGVVKLPTELLIVLDAKGLLPAVTQAMRGP
jgi:purine-binding chemotaxis protein CheW